MKKILAMALVLVLTLVCAVGGTLAWLTAKTDQVINTFSTSDINITLAETTGSTYKMVPGCTINKDPVATVLAGSEDCYLFIKIEQSSSYGTYLEAYALADGWTQLKNGQQVIDGVFYRIVNVSATDQSFSILSGNQVTVKSSVTKAQMEALNVQGAVLPTLTFTAYASQLYRTNGQVFTPYDAWTNVYTAT